MMEKLGLRHQSSGLNSGFAGAGLAFADYVAQTQAMLRQAHAGQADLEKIVLGNSPFATHPVASNIQKGQNKPYRRGVLLVHGLTDSPYHMRYLADEFLRQGFFVIAVLLPGHGTQPGDLLDMHWQEWAKTVDYGVDCVAAEAEQIYLAGFSAGAALSVLHAAQDERVRGLFLFSPALEITSLAAWANLHKLYSWLMPKAAWVSVMPDRDIYKYESFCKNAAAQMYALTQRLPAQGIDIPVFTAASADDTTVSSAATLRFMQRARHPYPCRHLVWYATERIEQQNVEWINSSLPEQRILSSAHTAIVMPPEDPHYGAQGDYMNCLHYYADDPERYAGCSLASQAIWQGEVNEQNLQHGLLRRLTYNPHFAALRFSLQTFIERLP